MSDYVKEYVQWSEKTLSKTFHYDNEDENESELRSIVEEVVKNLDTLDLYKKKKFYGKKVDIPQRHFNLSLQEFKKDEDGAEKMLHAAIGLATEAGELMKAVYDAKWGGKELDAVNVVEELGDKMWYFSIFLRELNADMEEVLRINKNKLEARYKKKEFTSENAINRDLGNERQILEDGK
jgi:NTP pyrophosphatase (non-canonical NTP hydrolase)